MKEVCGCPGSSTMDLRNKDENEEEQAGNVRSQLRQWPIQMHLIMPTAPYFQGADVVLSSDCVAFALGGFHHDHLKGKSIGIACPKLDEGQDGYIEKIRSWIDDAKINSLTVMIMQVPCCMGMVHLAKEAMKMAKRKIPVKYQVVSIEGEILTEEWLSE